jgi:hypothetical protein
MLRKSKLAALAALVAAASTSTAWAYGGHNFGRGMLRSNVVASCEATLRNLHSFQCDTAANITPQNYHPF